MSKKISIGLNPFENQVYFYEMRANEIYVKHGVRLNPFENQVYFYAGGMKGIRNTNGRLNPFENQVYFYAVGLDGVVALILKS